MTNAEVVNKAVYIAKDFLNDIKRKYCSMCSHEKNCWKPCVTVIEYMEKKRYEER